MDVYKCKIDFSVMTSSTPAVMEKRLSRCYEDLQPLEIRFAYILLYIHTYVNDQHYANVSLVAAAKEHEDSLQHLVKHRRHFNIDTSYNELYHV